MLCVASKIINLAISMYSITGVVFRALILAAVTVLKITNNLNYFQRMKSFLFSPNSYRSTYACFCRCI